MPAKQQLRRALASVGLEDRAVAVRRAFEPASRTQDRRDHESLATIFAAALAPDSNCVDVGAHGGDVLDDLLRIAPHGRHLAFEPLPDLAAALQRRLPSVDVRAVALSDTTGTATFAHVLDRPGWSGLKARPTPDGAAARVATISVPTQRLDDALPPGYVPRLVKVDVEGAELQVLRGARETLAAHRPIVVFEHGLGSADHYGTRPEDVHDLLGALGYRILGLQGQGPFDRQAFATAFHTAALVNFLATP
ncbi:MAG TPA: FkbM family methyltransferase [Baekduia sp.]|uniref:FkbM family methyltransferase n=1 Tax=Baekduia sp. TaxID=2600305 RepID=UPI002D778571|nr:FkbM family methyltransferase [Baekduia sp.]HET6510469.1 FkbM family methyltransferase [Baekduia sp.]